MHKVAEPYPNLVMLAMAATAEAIPVDAGKDLRRWRTGGDSDNPETKSDNNEEARAREFEEFSK